ncbi:P-loop containing nucleoside triphosphate hydrolase protein [Metschnikowia bicuspidata]|uniref:ATP-dependent RNA helicase n=1 Tax=Metschnikowia bicuspidata TaxID=27322 RepID=A0A4P9Z790_9ASCO|nr:P-loop containing nucleoside triphosphate hydrolase protein [Metschnikowia bicuspidata]RKP29116.1 P-loop containing nucleoside triphosphate hydrolase protein [Metschnikowia bicuspidata]
MFAPRFDPDAEFVEKAPISLLLRKRKLSNASSGLQNEKSSSTSCGSNSSDSDSDSDSSSDRDRNDAHEESISKQKEEVANMEVDESMQSNPEKESIPNDPHEEEVIDNYVNMHSKIFSKFKSIRPLNVVESDKEDEEEEVEVQALAPIPQPEIPKDEVLTSALTYLKNLNWLAKPAVSTSGNQRPFTEFALNETILKNLTKLGFTSAFSVQISVLELMLEDIRKNKLCPDFRGDILVNSSTGSGKTLAYAIPIIQALQERMVPRVRAIVLVPTKPLITQVAATLRAISLGTLLTVISLMNDLSLNEEAVRLTANVPDIIVSTPGRLVDHLLAGVVSLEALRFLVIDEADRLLHLAYQNWCQIVVSNIEKWYESLSNLANKWALMPQKLVFSATLTTDAGKLSLLKLCKPRLFVINSIDKPNQEMFTVPSTLKEHKMYFTTAKSAQKPLLLAKFLLDTRRLESVLIFAKSNDATLRLTRLLNDLFEKFLPRNKIIVAYMNSTNNTSSIRARTLRDFDEKRINILVATDLIARGIDITSIACVVNYDLPTSSREYVHRVGRTARANSMGEAFTMCFGGKETKWFTTMMSDIDRFNDIEDAQTPTVDDDDEEIYNKVMAKFLQEL